MPLRKEDSVVGCLLGTAVGDALGLPFEALSKRRLGRIYPDIDGHHFFLGRGMTSDDTEHTCLVAQALIVSGGEVEAFARNLAWRLRFWLLGLPVAIGFATLRAILKLWLGFPPDRSGVRSAGNAPAMRSAVIGICYGHDRQKLYELVGVSTRITHTDPKAEWGALAVALAAHLASSRSEPHTSPLEYCQALETLLGREAQEFLALVRKAAESAETRESTESFAAQLGLSQGVSVDVYHTVPVALQSWLKHQQDYRAAVLEVVRCGGDTDTLAAIVGGIIGARVGKSGIPQEWLAGLWEWPRTVKWLEELGRTLARVSSEGKGQRAVPLPVYGLLLRNLFFFVVVLVHGFRRVLPPY